MVLMLAVFFIQMSHLQTLCILYPTRWDRNSWPVLDRQPLTFFLALLELDSTTADGIISELLNCLLKHDLDEVFLKECLVGFCSDWAAVMVRKTNGVYSKLKSKFAGLKGWHCLNHRLELSVTDAIKHWTETNHFTAFLDKLYCLNNQSPKNLRGALCSSLWSRCVFEQDCTSLRDRVDGFI